MTYPPPWPDGPTTRIAPYRAAAYPPPVGVAPYGYAPQPPRPQRRSRLPWVVAGVVVCVAVAGGIGGVLWQRNAHKESQLAQIRDTVTAFAEASDTANAGTMASLMCRAEAAEFTDDPDYDPNAAPISPGTRAPVNLGAISVTGDAATVDMTRPPAAPVTLKLKHEDGAWKLCNPASA